MRRIFGTTLVVLSLTAATAIMPAHAAQTSSGEIAFSGSAFLPTYPCPVTPEQPSGCTGRFFGSASGELAGVNGTTPWTATLAAAPIDVTFTYRDDCPLPIGIAGGSTTIYMHLNGGAVGTYGPPAGATHLPWPVVAIGIPVRFDWGRAGLVAKLDTATSITLTVNTGGSTTNVQVAFEHTGTGVAAFAPTTVPGLCTAPSSLSAFILGAITVPA